VFFITESGYSVATHVAVVYSVTQSGFRFLQSNAPTKDGWVPFNDNGVGVGTGFPWPVVGFGIP